VGRAAGDDLPYAVSGMAMRLPPVGRRTTPQPDHQPRPPGPPQDHQHRAVPPPVQQQNRRTPTDDEYGFILAGRGATQIPEATFI